MVSRAWFRNEGVEAKVLERRFAAGQDFIMFPKVSWVSRRFAIAAKVCGWARLR